MSNQIVKCRIFDAQEFLATVRQFPFLFDKKEFKFKDTRLKERQWNQIGLLFGMTGEACANKFKNIKDRYTKIINSVEKAAANGDAMSEIRFIRWKLFPIIHDLLESSSLNKNLPFDIRELLKYKPITLIKNNNDSCDAEDEDVVDLHQSQHIFAIKPEPLNDDQDADEITVEEHDCDQSFASGSATTSSNDKFAFNNDHSTPAAMAKSSSSQRKRMRESDNSISNHSVDWTVHMDALENARKGKRKAPIDSEEDDEITFFTSFVKCRLMKFDRKKRITIMHQIENILYKEEMETL